MAALSMDDIYRVARAAGFPSATAVKMVAIAIKESAGIPTAHNAKPPDDSYGLWQINMLGALGPDRRAKLGIASNDALFDPAVNARAAYLLWGGSDANLARHWYINLPGYNADKYNQVLPLAQAAADRVEGVAAVEAPPPDTSGGEVDSGNVDSGEVDAGGVPAEIAAIGAGSIPTPVWIGLGCLGVALLVDLIGD